MFLFIFGFLLGSGLTATLAIWALRRIESVTERRVVERLGECELMTTEAHRDVLWRHGQAMRSRAEEMLEQLEREL